MKSTLALALALGLAFPVLADAPSGAGLQQKGTPEANAGTLTTYGIEVPVRSALKSLIPTGWRLFVHKSAALPSALSWKPGDVWTDVLSKAALSADLAALVDWDSRTVLIRTREVALQEGAVRTEIAQAASTPLPRFETPAEVKPAVVAIAKSAPASLQDTAAPVPTRADKAASSAESAQGVYSINTAPAPSMPVEMASAISAPAMAAPDVAQVAQASETAQPESVAAVAAAEPTPTAEPAKVAEVVAQPVSSPVAEPVLAASAPPEQPATAVAQDAAGKDQALAKAVTAAINERFAAPEQKQRFSVDASGNIVATDAMSALVAASTQQDKAQESAEAGPAGRAALQALLSAAKAEEQVLQAQVDKARADANAKKTKPSTLAVALKSAKPSQPGQAVAEAPAAATPVPTIAFAAPMAAEPAVTIPVGPFAAPAAIAPAAPVTLALQNPVPADVPSVPVFRVNPSSEMVKEQAAALKDKPARLASTKDFTYTEPVALNKAPARTVAQAIANRYGLRLVWVAPDIKMQGPVTLLSESAEQDVELFRKAMGLFAPVTMEFSIVGDLRIVSKDATFVAAHQAAAAARATQERALAAQAAIEAREAAQATGNSSATTQATALQVPALQLVVEQGDALETAIKRFVQAQGYTHEWKVAGGFDANRRLTFEGNTLAEVLSQVLPDLGVSADIYTTDKHIVIRPGDYRE